jgi:hypothetical protein
MGPGSSYILVVASPSSYTYIIILIISLLSTDSLLVPGFPPSQSNLSYSTVQEKAVFRAREITDKWSFLTIRR